MTIRSRTPTLALLAAGSLLLTACAVPVTQTTRVYDAPGYAAAPAVRYGTVRRIDVIDTRAQPTGGGTVIGALVGGVIGNQFGHGSGRAAVTALGAVGGAVVGTQVERNQAAASSSTVYRVMVEFDDGQRRHFDYRSLNGLRAGERVRLQGDELDRA